MRGISRCAMWVAAGLLLTAADVGGQTIILSDPDRESDIFGHVHRQLRLGLLDAGYEVHWLPNRVPEGEDGLELIFQVIETDNGYDATFVLSSLYHDEELGVLRDQPTILYQFHGFETLDAIAEAALSDFLERLEEEKAMAGESEEG